MVINLGALAGKLIQQVFKVVLTGILECVQKTWWLVSVLIFWASTVTAEVTDTYVNASIQNLNVSPFILVDQFGYLPESQKIAVIRDPEMGFDQQESFTPNEVLQLVDVKTRKIVYRSRGEPWHQGRIAQASGDRAWWFDFSAVKAPGNYVVVDPQNKVRSPQFSIAENVYREVLKQAVRTFFYQRVGFAKVYPYADLGWTDGASHVGGGQDKSAQKYNGGADSAKDLSGGWYDAGDYNKYTNWHAWYVISLLHAYRENPAIWTDDFNIPESGNGIPDLIDEIIWGLDWLLKMQEADGAVISVMHLSSGSPPSTAKGPSIYGGTSTSATLSAAAAYAFAGDLLLQVDSVRYGEYAKILVAKAELAWQWAEQNPQVIFRNQAHNLAAGEQEVDETERQKKRIAAAIYLYSATKNPLYHQFVLRNAAPIKFVNPWTAVELSHYFYYISLPDASTEFVEDFRKNYQTNIRSKDNLKAISEGRDPYMAYLDEKSYTWGSNRTVALKGSLFYFLVSHKFEQFDRVEMQNSALGYLHYLHGVNPLATVYLSNMGAFGAHQSVNEFYHSWFTHGSPLWDKVGVSTYGPAPGFLVGGPNPSYDWDKVCQPETHRARCGQAALSPPKNQPAMKSYLEFNDSWPINSWQISENHNDYQVAYIRLLSKFVR